ncbi:MAG: hypothetical protein JW856_01350 [Dehalococcoidales bacterium]|nr:hypothetical protein [Dehalococcoidales bacterium]
MNKIFKNICRNEQGQALLIVLALLVFGGLTITPCLNFTATSLANSRAIKSDLDGIYAADAGVENAIWCLEHNQSPPTQLSGELNQMDVTLLTEDMGSFIMYLGEMLAPGEHADYLSIHGEIEWNETAQAYKYTITVTMTDSEYPIIHLTGIGARLPVGYSYVTSSAADFPDNLSNNEPDIIYDSMGAQMVNWEFSTPSPSVTTSDPVVTQTFYFTGEEEIHGNYAWVVANREDIGGVGEINGTLYLINATATNTLTGEVTGRISAKVMMVNGLALVMTWEILK